MALMTKKRQNKVAAKKFKMRNTLWPGLDDKKLWNRGNRVGFLTIPRAMPLILAIMDDMANGKPVAKVYLDLWCRTYDDSFAIVTKPREHAFACGFAGQRAEGTWTQRVKILQELGFIDVKPGPSGPFNYILIKDPFDIIKRHKTAGTPGILPEAYNALQERMIEIGANDLDDEAAASDEEEEEAESFEELLASTVPAKVKTVKPLRRVKQTSST